jgi:hypothetical protein
MPKEIGKKKTNTEVSGQMQQGVMRFKAALPTGNYMENPESLVRDVNGPFVKYSDYEEVRKGLLEALEWNWLDDDAPKEVMDRLLKLT